MEYIEKVTGSEIASAPLIMNIDTIYVHTNIHKVESQEDEEDMNLYEYTERQYTYGEYKENCAEIEQIFIADGNTQYPLSVLENMFIEKLKQLYKDKRMEIKAIDEIYGKGNITDEEYSYIIDKDE